MNGRKIYLDNVRFIMIFLVVFAHLLECMRGHYGHCKLYLIIYSFHMPVLIFISGYFAHFHFKKIFQLFFEYFLFQTLYILFDFYVLKTTKHLVFDYTIPKWILWYLFTLLFYVLCIPILKRAKHNFIRGFFFLTSIAICLICPLFIQSGYSYSLLRSTTFLPFFVLGFYLKDRPIVVSKKMKNFLKAVNIVLVMGSIFILVYSKNFTPQILYGSYSYKKANYTIWIKLLSLLIAWNWIFFFCFTIRINKEIPFLTKIGKNTLSIYLLHGFLLLYIKKMNWFSPYEFIHHISLFLLAIAIICTIGNRFVSTIFTNVFTVNNDIDKIQLKKKLPGIL